MLRYGLASGQNHIPRWAQRRGGARVPMILAWLAAAWLAGIVAAAVFGHGAWPLCAALLGALMALAIVRRGRAGPLLLLLVLVVFAAGALRFEQSRSALPADAVAHFNDGPAMRIRGVLEGDPQIGDRSQQFRIGVRQIELEGTWQPASGGVLVRSGLIPTRLSGDVVELEGVLDTPGSSAEFDYAQYLAQRGIRSTILFPQVRGIGHEDDAPITAVVLAVRRRLSHALALALPEPQASLAQGVLLGERSALPRDIAGQMNDTNTSHLIVVSGENVVLVSTYVTILLAWAVGRRRALALSIGAVLAYAMLVGMSPPVGRATIMGILLVIARLNGRPTHGLTAILLAAALMTGLDPDAARDVSFQLSFAATAGILYLASPLRHWLIELVAWASQRDVVPRAVGTFFAEPLSVTLAATIATGPLLALNFGRLSLVGLPANLLVVPAFPLILAGALLAAIGGLLPHLHLVFAAPAYYALTYWLVVTRWLAGVPHAAPSFGGYGSWWTALTYAAIAGASAVLLRRFVPRATSRLEQQRPMQHRTLVAVLGVPAIVLAVSVGAMMRPSGPAHLRVTVLDVGQGDAILIQTPAGDDILVDGGPGPAVLRGLSDELPWTDRSIELMVLTHPQEDHLVGLLDVLDRYDVQRVLAGPGQQQSAGYHAWLLSAEQEGTAIEVARAGMSIDLGRGVRMDVLGPDAEEASDPQINNTGAVLRVSWGEVSFLLTADIEAKAERALLADGVALHSTVLKVPHHGSDTSSSAEFLTAVSPEVSVISAGRDNPFGHPRPDVLARLLDYGPAYTTADVGPVHFETDGHVLWTDAGK